MGVGEMCVGEMLTKTYFRKARGKVLTKTYRRKALGRRVLTKTNRRKALGDEGLRKPIAPKCWARCLRNLHGITVGTTVGSLVFIGVHPPNKPPRLGGRPVT